MTLSSINASLSILSELLEAFCYEDSVEGYTPQLLLAKLVDLVFWWPSVETDEKEAENCVHKEEEEGYYEEFVKFGMKHMRKAAQMWAEGAVA